MSIPTDQLEERLERRDGTALEQLLLIHQRAIARRIASRLPPSLATVVSSDDLTQECFANAFRSVRTFRKMGPDSFSRWILVIADNAVRDAIRRQTAGKRGGDMGVGVGAVQTASGSWRALVDLCECPNRTPGSVARQRDNVSLVKEAMDNIQPAQREALVLRYVQGLAIAEVAAKMGRSETAVNKLLARGLEGVRALVEEASSRAPS